ncbi:MAG: DUF169 domain-containing protein [Candidatus Aerophobetes bacterium]|nr:DUF169 domain-containing protein [Candidatus Aerophobetes bacterium]
MIELDVFHKYGEEIEKQLRLKSFPLAIKLLRKGEGIAEGAKRPKRDLGFHLSTCQAFSISRREGTHLAMLKEDMWCFEPVIGYGLARPPKYFLDGYNRFPETARTLEAGKNWARAFPHLEYDKYTGIVSAPLTKANFEPDLVMIYCNPAQLTQLLIVVNWIDGHDITCRLSGHAACVYSIVPVIQRRQYQVSSLCIGDRRRATAQDNELVFTAPKEKIEDLVLGLKALAKSGAGLPVKFTVIPEYELEESYAKIGKMLGMEVK